jgi:hypothetical protein
LILGIFVLPPSHSHQAANIVPHQENKAATSNSARVASATTDQDAINSGIVGSATSVATSPASTTMVSFMIQPSKKVIKQQQAEIDRSTSRRTWQDLEWFTDFTFISSN